MPRVPPVKRDAVAALVRRMIADGSLKPGGALPSYAALGRETGCSPLTCREALRPLVTDGTLMAGASENARLRVAQAHPGREALLADALSRTLAGLRRAGRLTQPDLAGMLGVSVTTVGHAETGRPWQAREFWEHADHLLGGGGRLLRLYGSYQAARNGLAQEEDGDAVPGEPVPAVPVLPVRVTITAEGVLITWPGGAQTLAEPPGCQG